MEINKPMTTRNMLASTLTDYKKPVKLPKITVELDPMLKKRWVKGQNVCLARRVAGVRFGLFECRLSGCSRCR